uniref:Uncharacterized protein n=1 Tax=Romanomermis culicivorax TaxID=13658 RepID=A0A915KKQ5_ROMCU
MDDEKINVIQGIEEDDSSNEKNDNGSHNLVAQEQRTDKFCKWIIDYLGKAYIDPTMSAEDTQFLLAEASQYMILDNLLYRRDLCFWQKTRNVKEYWSHLLVKFQNDSGVQRANLHDG